MSEITIADTAKYNCNKKMQTYGIFFASLLPLSLVAMFSESNVPQILDNEQAIELCRQESLDTTPLTEDGLHINLSKPEINACADSKIAQSGQTRSAYIENREENAWKIFSLIMVFSAASLTVAGRAFKSNEDLLKEKPDLEKLVKPGMFERTPRL